MYLLFLDTETSGVDFAQDQIIEIGGLICDLDPVSLELKEISSFESLVKNRQKLEDKITRITGITSQDLATAPNLHKVQEDWISWLSELNLPITAIVGHSLYFDVNFLKKENWFIPEKAAEIDTLDLAKIVFPNLFAVNLEFLVEKLFPQRLGGGGHHRSLFDSRMCSLVFSKILKQLTIYKLPAVFFKLLKENFLKIPLDFVNLNLEFKSFSNLEILNLDPNLEINEEDSQDSVQEIFWQGEKKPESFQSLSQKLASTKVLLEVENLLKQSNPEFLNLLFLQIYFLLNLKIDNPNLLLKLHLRNQLKVFWVLDIIWDFLLDKQESKVEKYRINRLESLLWQVQSIAEDKLEIAKIVELTGLVTEFLQINGNCDDLVKELLKTQSAYDFLHYYLVPVMHNYNFYYNPRESYPEQQLIFSKLKELFERFKLLPDLFAKISSSIHPLFPLLQKSILNHLNNKNWDYHQSFQISLIKDNLILFLSKPNFHIHEALNNLIKKFSDLEIQSYLQPDNLVVFLKLSGLDNLNLEVKSLITEKLPIEHPENLELQSFLKKRLQVSKSQNAVIWLLGGQNSSIRDLQNCLTENFSKEDYLVLGESGSITKISSKIIKGFKGLAVGKLSSLTGFMKTKEVSKPKEVWIINQPYFFIHKYWQNRAKGSSDPTKITNFYKYLYLQSWLNYIYFHTGVVPGFIKSYK